MNRKTSSFRFTSNKAKTHEPRKQRRNVASAGTNDRMLVELQHDTFGYFLHEANLDNGQVIDKTSADAPASIAAVGLALTDYPIGV